MKRRIFAVLAAMVGTTALLYWQLGNAPAVVGGVLIGAIGTAVLCRIVIARMVLETEWHVWEHELPADASATQMREAIGPPFGLGFEDDTEDDEPEEVVTVKTTEGLL